MPQLRVIVSSTRPQVNALSRVGGITPFKPRLRLRQVARKNNPCYNSAAGVAVTKLNPSTGK